MSLEVINPSKTVYEMVTIKINPSVIQSLERLKNSEFEDREFQPLFLDKNLD